MIPFLLTSTPLTGLVAGSPIDLDDDVLTHVNKVLRLQNGSEVELTDGRGRVAVAILKNARAVLQDDVYVDLPRQPGLTVFQALAKGRKHDEVVRVLTEFGVERIVAISAEQSLSVLRDDKVDRVRKRWEAVARSAVQQSRNAHAPEILGPVGIELAVEELPEGATLLVADTTADVIGISDVVDAAEVHVALAIGPESGWTDQERALWRMLGASFVTLGATILRTEHAALVGAAAVATLTGRLDA